MDYHCIEKPYILFLVQYCCLGKYESASCSAFTQNIIYCKQYSKHYRICTPYCVQYASVQYSTKQVEGTLCSFGPKNIFLSLLSRNFSAVIPYSLIIKWSGFFNFFLNLIIYRPVIFIFILNLWQRIHFPQKKYLITECIYSTSSWLYFCVFFCRQMFFFAQVSRSRPLGSTAGRFYKKQKYYNCF